jgi:hypothetical protein
MHFWRAHPVRSPLSSEQQLDHYAANNSIRSETGTTATPATTDFRFPLPLPTEANRELDDARRENSRGAAKPIEIFRRVKGGSLEDCRKSGRFLFVRRPPQRKAEEAQRV